MTAPLQYNFLDTGEQQFITVFAEGRALTADDSHPNFTDIVEGAQEYSLHILDLFDVSTTVSGIFEALSERVAVSNGHVFFDGDEQDDSITQQIVRFLDEDVDDWKPLVAFMENVAANPLDHSREQLFDWLRARDFTITQDGLIVGYKGVTKDEDGSLRSGFRGHAIVNGEPVTGYIPNAVGNVVEMPRSSVAHDPSAACSVGLHVGTFEYAKGYASGALLKVLVNPRDVVSVPTDARGAKVRVCRYTVQEIIDAPETAAVVDYDADEADDDYYYDEGY